jgi:tRNA-specific 2-thiouridylase
MPILKTASALIKEALEKVSINNLLPPKGSKIAIAMSGGVDSSVAAALLSQMDYEVFGITGWLMEGKGKCCDGGMLDAGRICEIIGISHEVQDLKKLFQSTIISPFIESYSIGRTPVPCMPCNTEVKWGSLLEYSKSIGASHLASGHYARLLGFENVDNSYQYSIGKSKDLHKDQSYMLWGLSQEQLSRTLFPLANFDKDEIRELAKEFNLVNWDKEESQDICFVPNKTKDFLKEHLGEKPGEIKNIRTGKVLGKHSGTHFYTIGQRKGIGISSQDAIYVVKIDSFNNVVYVGEKSDLQNNYLIADGVNWQIVLSEPFRALVKIRYNSEPSICTVTPIEANQIQIDFDEPVLGVTPGQAAVIYDLNNQYIIAGGWISRELNESISKTIHATSESNS